MTDITKDMIDAIYEISREIRAGQVSHSEAVRHLKNEEGFNKNSATNYLHALRHLYEGTRFTRTINLRASKRFLDRIHEDYGKSGLILAVKAIEAFLAYRKKEGHSEPGLRKILAKYSTLSPAALNSMQDEIERSILEAHEAEATSDAELEHLARLAPNAPAPKIPVQTTYRRRNPYVRELVLRRANGVCGACGKPAPFQSQNKRPYLEIHHRIPLAEDGEDTIENAVALCPNCHREAHFGEDWKKYRP